MAVKRKKASQLTADEVMRRIFGQRGLAQARELTELRKPLRPKKKRISRKKV
jgi:hypothetical protein